MFLRSVITLFISLLLFLLILLLFLVFLYLFQLLLLPCGGEGFERFLAISELLQFRHKEAIEIVDVRVYSLAKVHGGCEPLLLVGDEAGLADFEASLHKFHVPVFEGKIYDSFVLFDRDTAGGVTIE